MIKCPFTYKDNKNNDVYKTIGISIPTKQYKLQKIYDKTLKKKLCKYGFTSNMEIYKDIKNNYYHDKEESSSKLVIYTKEADSNYILAMDLNKFISIIREKTNYIESLHEILASTWTIAKLMFLFLILYIIWIITFGI
ncbi:TPA: hypothetical protein KPJ62_003693 [Clostridioides difficile]|nr:hypothetical protein [Clostridioides difficile]